MTAIGADPNLYREDLSRKQGKGGKTATLDQYSRDLTALAREGKLDPVIGREEEIRRVIQILSRRTKNNPCLIGEAWRCVSWRDRSPLRCGTSGC